MDLLISRLNLVDSSVLGGELAMNDAEPNHISPPITTSTDRTSNDEAVSRSTNCTDAVLAVSPAAVVNPFCRLLTSTFSYVPVIFRRCLARYISITKITLAVDSGSSNASGAFCRAIEDFL